MSHSPFSVPNLIFQKWPSLQLLINDTNSEEVQTQLSPNIKRRHVRARRFRGVRRLPRLRHQPGRVLHREGGQPPTSHHGDRAPEL